MSFNWTLEQRLLLREAEISATSLATGMTCIRNYTYSESGQLQIGFFMLSIGIERLMKLILLYDHQLAVKTYPDNRYLRKYSHNISELFEKCKSIAEAHNLNNLY